MSAEGYAYIFPVLPIQGEQGALMSGRRYCFDQDYKVRAVETKQNEIRGYSQNNFNKNFQINYRGLAFCSVVVHAGDIVFLRGHLDEIRVQPDTAARVKHDSGMNVGF